MQSRGMEIHLNADESILAEGLKRVIKKLKRLFVGRPEKKHFLKPDWRSRQASRKEANHES